MATESKGKVLLRVRPRGFCAGVVRAVDIVELALEAYGAPVYVHHEIVHNTYVVEQLRRRGAIFVESIDEVPHGAVLVFSAHGVPPAAREKLPIFTSGYESTLVNFSPRVNLIAILRKIIEGQKKRNKKFSTRNRESSGKEKPKKTAQRLSSLASRAGS